MSRQRCWLPRLLLVVVCCSWISAQEFEWTWTGSNVIYASYYEKSESGYLSLPDEDFDAIIEGNFGFSAVDGINKTRVFLEIGYAGSLYSLFNESTGASLYPMPALSVQQAYFSQALGNFLYFYAGKRSRNIGSARLFSVADKVHERRLGFGAISKVPQGIVELDIVPTADLGLYTLFMFLDKKRIEDISLAQIVHWNPLALPLSVELAAYLFSLERVGLGLTSTAQLGQIKLFGEAYWASGEPRYSLGSDGTPQSEDIEAWQFTIGATYSNSGFLASLEYSFDGATSVHDAASAEEYFSTMTQIDPLSRPATILKTAPFLSFFPHRLLLELHFGPSIGLPVHFWTRSIFSAGDPGRGFAGMPSALVQGGIDHDLSQNVRVLISAEGAFGAELGEFVNLYPKRFAITAGIRVSY